MKSDGCSGFMSFFWRRFLGHPPPWEGLCDDHDDEYRLGGSLWKRVVADFRLGTGVWLLLRANGRWDFWFWSIVMFLAVRVGGVWWIPFPTVIPQADGSWKWSWSSVRWGYQWAYPFYMADQSFGDILYPRVMCLLLVALAYSV